jgi:GMP synthase-like glutamine amidotransferase
MLRCTMIQNSMNTRLGLDDVLGDLLHARRVGNVGRLALVAYCEVRRWARQAGELALAEHSAELVMKSPHPSRDEFLHRVDQLIDELENVRRRLS